MNKTITYLFVTLFTSHVTLASTPTIDSLLRNANNIDLTEQTIVANILVRKKNLNNQNNLENSVPARFAHKFILTSGFENIYDFVQIDYRDTDYEASSINSFVKRRSFSPKYFSNLSIEGQVFYGLMKSLLLNKSDLFISFLSKVDSKIVKNNRNINIEQKKLLHSYREYLKNLEDEADRVNNPLQSENIEKSKKLTNILSQNFLNNSSNIKRVFRDKRFYLLYESEKLKINFDNETHQIISFSLLTKDGRVEVELMNYVLFSKGFEFPEVISLKTSNGDSYEISLKKISVIKDTKESFYKRLERYKKQLEKVDDQIVNLKKPNFLL